MNKNQVELYQARWLSLFAQKKSELALKIYDLLDKKYSEKHRYYHDFSHIIACLKHFDSVKYNLTQPLSVELAIWFHDVIYDPYSSKNELMSAELAVSELNKLSVDSVTINQVYNMILLTKHPSQPTNNDENYLIDIDLAILGSSRDIFLNYELGIRSEYSWVADNIYQEKRSLILEAFLQQDRIYQTNYFYGKLEASARKNLKHLLKSFYL